MRPEHRLVLKTEWDRLVPRILRSRLGCPSGGQAVSWVVALTLMVNGFYGGSVSWAEDRAPFAIRAVFQQKAPEEAASLSEAHGVVGLNLMIQHGRYPQVHGVFPGTPAALQGIKAGDQILFINGSTTWGKTVPQVDAMISDVPGDAVAFTLQRGPRLVQVRLTVAPLEGLSPTVRPQFSGLFGIVPSRD